MMKQDEVSKTQETIKTESAAAVVIMEAIGMKTEVQEGVRKDTVEEDKNETDGEDMTKKVEEQCLKRRGCRLVDAEHDLDRRELTEAVMLKSNPDGKHDEVNVRERVNLGVWEDRFDRDAVGDGDDDDKKTAGKYGYEMAEVRDVMGDITDAVVTNIEYEASIKAHQGRELNMHKMARWGRR